MSLYICTFNLVVIMSLYIYTFNLAVIMSLYIYTFNLVVIMSHTYKFHMAAIDFRIIFKCGLFTLSRLNTLCAVNKF